MIKEVPLHVKELELMKKYPKELFYKGNLELLQRTKVSIVGSRKPNQYARDLTHKLSCGLSQVGVVVVSGGAIGIDAIAHKGAGVGNTIMVSGVGLDRYYPSTNKSLIQDIEKNGLVLSQFRADTPSFRYNFPLRNELIVALGEVLLVMYADENSGTQRSIEFAKKMGKEIYVLPHRLGQSGATNRLLENGEAKAIYDIDKFIKKFGNVEKKQYDAFLEFCKTNPSYDEAISKYGDKVFEYELLGKIVIKNSKIFVEL